MTDISMTLMQYLRKALLQARVRYRVARIAGAICRTKSSTWRYSRGIGVLRAIRFSCKSQYLEDAALSKWVRASLWQKSDAAPGKSLVKGVGGES